MTESQREALRYKDYPEGSGGKAIYDRYFLPFTVFLVKYYSDPENKEWDRWISKYIEPAFDAKRHDEMIKNFGYKNKEYHNFEVQYAIYEQLISDTRLTDDVRMFIGFLAGSNGIYNFFCKHNITIAQWFEIRNWYNPYLYESNDERSINEILGYPYGINYLKTLLPQMPNWKR